ncbi:hypothetical protein MTX26_35140 (plasmid) [Bradyrhizobium sp. ISRA443]|uniref:hypothetical protein n=1 Tax=unclassified Bradyrhizobium TaxID=2631580 RepID=UPI002478DD9B|nr:MULTISPECIES: hypothetical protein [unclassified Bradyrhizobium]WGS03194.1 hypothetical protein MTX23_35480 [Bradyrhizobium sp. ISRA436]WGS10012.1 hypothetical protein MTX18_35140 [Bradyrhizobium sp. ISRA437]WGS16897.1 hypothetical protein MTX26_35140 [Bradyrhizobium sp. ISRA443]
MEREEKETYFSRLETDEQKLLMIAPSLAKNFRDSQFCSLEPNGSRERYGALSSNRRSALLASYLADRLLLDPVMTSAPSVVQTDHDHLRPRRFKKTP